MPKVPSNHPLLLESHPPALQPPSAAPRVRPRKRSLARTGAVVGVLAFLAVALYPALVFGGTAGAQLAMGVLGGDGRSPGGVAAFAGLGVLSAVGGGVALFAAAGAAIGAAIAALTGAPGGRP